MINELQSKVAIEEEYEAALRRAFVDRRADYIVISSRCQQFQIESAQYGVNQGWLTGSWDTHDIQSTEWRLRLTMEGRKRFGID